MFCVKWILFLCFLIVAKEGLAGLTNDYDIEKIIQNVPKKERYNFIKYYSAIGYELSSDKANNAGSKTNNVQFAELDSLSKFCIDLYEWLIKKSNSVSASGTARARSFYSNVICFPNNQCVDIGDVGVHP